MTDERNRIDWGFVARWVLITTLTTITATAVAFPVLWSVAERLFGLLGEGAAAAVAGILFGALVGLGLGGGQSVALIGRDISTARLLLYSALGGGLALGLGLGIVAGLLSPPGVSDTQSALLFGSALGLGIGTGQWLAMRGRVANAGIWIVITLVAWVAAALVAFPLGGEERYSMALSIMGLIVATVTGLGAAWLLSGRRPVLAAHASVLLVLGLLLAGCGGSASEPTVRFAEPRDGASVAAPVKVVMSAENFTVEPAADGVHDGAGHLHIMVDTPCIEAGQAIPKDETHLHFGDGSIETELALASGTHTLCLQAADGAHIALPGDGMTHTITVTVP